MYGGDDPTPEGWIEALGEAHEHVERVPNAIEKNEERITRAYLEDRDPEGNVLSCASCGMRQRENVGKYQRLTFGRDDGLDALAVNASYEYDREIIFNICMLLLLLLLILSQSMRELLLLVDDQPRSVFP